MRRLLTVLLLLAGLPAFAQPGADSLFVPFPSVMVEPNPSDDEPSKPWKAELGTPVSLDLILACGSSGFVGEASGTFGRGFLFTCDGQLAYGRIRAGAGIGLSMGRLLEDYYYKGVWPEGEYYSHAQFFLTLGWDVLRVRKFRLTPYAGYGVRTLSYTYEYGEDEDDEKSWTRNAPCLYLGLETSFWVIPAEELALRGYGRFYASRAGFPGLSSNCWSLNFALGIDFAFTWQ